MSPDYSNLGSAVSDLENFGVSGAVTFNIRTGTYPERLVIGHIPTTSSVNQVVFQSETGNPTDVVITYDSDIDTNYTLFVDSAAYLTFKDLTLQATDQQYGRIVLLENNAHHNTFLNCDFEGINTVSNSDGLGLFRSNGSNSHLTLEGCTFQGGSKALMISSPNHDAVNNTIRDNAFFEQYLKAMELERVDGVVIEGNEIVSGSLNSLYEGIHLAECDSSVQVRRNTMDLVDPIKAIHIWRCFASGGAKAVVANNAVHISGGIGSSANGIFIFWSEHYDFVYNSIHLAESNAGSNIFTMTSVISDKIRLYNNSFSNLGDGSVLDIGWLPNLEVSDHNNLYTEGAVLAIVDTFLFGDLAAWQDTSTLDSNGISVDPLYPFTPDLHYPDTALAGKAMPLPGISLDLDGDVRDSLNPDIGADEFEWVAPVASFFSSLYTGCSPLTVDFFDQSQGPVTAYAWDVDGDGSDDYFTANPTHTYTTPGLYSVRLIVSNLVGADTNIWTDSIYVDPCTSVDEGLARLEAYPIPSDEALNVDLNGVSGEGLEVRVVDMAGRQVYREAYSASLSPDRVRIETEHFPAGMYLLTLENGVDAGVHIRFSVRH